MSIKPGPILRTEGGPLGRVPGLVLQLLAAAAFAGGLPDASASEPDSPDRAMAFVEKSVEATELFNQRKFAEALVRFEELIRDYGDLDEDGYIAMSLADCLVGLDRLDEARAMYESVAAGHASLAQAVQQKLRELALNATPDDALLDELRAAVAADLDRAYAANVQLGRALQRRAASLLAEAATVFRAAAEAEPNLTQPSRRLVSSQAEMLAEIQEDLTALISRMERAWGALQSLKEMSDQSDAATAAGVTYRAEWTSPVNAGQPLKFETTWAECGDLQVTVNGKPVVLDRTQSLIIRRHQERINALLNDAIKASPAEPAPAATK